MLHLLMSLPEPNLLTFLFLLDHLRRYTAPKALPSHEMAAISYLLPTLVCCQFVIYLFIFRGFYFDFSTIYNTHLPTHKAGFWLKKVFTPVVDL